MAMSDNIEFIMTSDKNRFKVEANSAAAATELDKDALFRSMKPILYSLKLCGLYFDSNRRSSARNSVSSSVKNDTTHSISIKARGGTVELDAEYMPEQPSSESTKRCSIPRLVSTVGVCLLWANAIRFLSVFQPSDGFGLILLYKLEFTAWQFLCAFAYTAYFYASKSGKLDEVLRSVPVKSDLLVKNKRRAIICVSMAWFAITANLFFFIYFLFIATQYDFILAPINTYIRIDSDSAASTAARVTFMILSIFVHPAWLLTQAMNTFLALFFHSQYKELYQEVKTVVRDAQNHFPCDDVIDAFRRRHAILSKAVRRTDQFVRISYIGHFCCNVFNVVAMVYTILFYPSVFSEPITALMFMFWTIANCFGLALATVGGIMVNHMAHKVRERIFDIDLSPLNSRTIGMLSTFLNRLSGEPIGFSILGIIVIRKDTILTLLALVITYFLLIVQLAPPTTTDFVTGNSTTNSITKFTAAITTHELTTSHPFHAVINATTFNTI